MYKKHPSTAFDDVGKRKKLNISEYDCCPFTWEFEGFMKRLDWARAYYITYLQYELQRNPHGCQSGTNANGYAQYMSFLVEIGEYCEWLRICFDQKGSGFCSNDANTLSFLFDHEVYIPTDSDEARPLGLVLRGRDNSYRINFMSGVQGIELGYAFADPTTPGIRDIMQLEVYDGKDPTNLQINVVRSPLCEARLINVPHIFELSNL